MQIEAASTGPVNERNSIAHVNKMLLDVTAKAMEQDDKKLSYDVEALIEEQDENARASNGAQIGINIIA